MNRRCSIRVSVLERRDEPHREEHGGGDGGGDRPTGPSDQEAVRHVVARNFLRLW